MISIAIEPDSAVVRLSGWDRVFALRGSICLPLAAITAACPAPELVDQRPRGFRFPGSAWPFWPGPLFAGSFVDRQHRWSFWAVRRPVAEHLLKIEVNDREEGNRYRLLVLQVDDPTADARRIRQAIDDRRQGEDRRTR